MGTNFPTQAGSYLDIPVFNALFPKEGGKVVPITLDFTTNTAILVDLTLMQQRGYINIIQSVFIDNSANSVPVLFSFNGSNMPLRVPGNSQAVLPIFMSNPPRFTATCSGGNVVPIILANIPMPAAVWNATAAFDFDGSGNLLVSDAALDACITSGILSVGVNAFGNADTAKLFYVGDEMFTGSTATSTAQTITTGSPSFFITSLDVLLSGDAALAAAAEYTVTIKDGATTIAQGIAALPSASVTDGRAPISLIRLPNLQYNSKGNGNNLLIQGSAALSSGKLFWNIAGGLTSQIGP